MYIQILFGGCKDTIPFKKSTFRFNFFKKKCFAC
jgi:hypothetical protein